VEGSTLIVDSPFSDSGVTQKRESRKTSRNSGDDQGKNRVKVRIVVDDTLAVARAMSHQSAEAGTDTDEGGKPSSSSSSSSRPKRNVAVLNMASPLLPGGGFFNGATAQEETLCNRTTLYPALRDEFYRLPEVGAIWTEDVMVFRDESGKDLNKGERWWIDVISAGMLRFPDVEAEGEEEGEEHEKQKKYANPKDRHMAIEKIRCVMEILESKGVEKCVLGAWGCGAYGNPVPEIARAFKKVIWGGEVKGGRKTGMGGVCWGSLREVAFAIKEGKTASEFAKHFGVEVALEKRPTLDQQEETNEEDERAAETRRDLEDKIRELDLRINLSNNPALKAPLETIRADLRSQLALKQSSATANSDSLDEEDDESQTEDDTKSE
jgi:uncharacterized protein (TIGR02452 family)